MAFPGATPSIQLNSSEQITPTAEARSSMKIGYSRVSTKGQNGSLDPAEGSVGRRVAHMFEVRLTGANSAKPGLEAALDNMCNNDVLVVTRLDQLGSHGPGHPADDRGTGPAGRRGDRAQTRAEHFHEGEQAHGDGRSGLTEFERDLLIEPTKEGAPMPVPRAVWPAPNRSSRPSRCE